MSAITKAEQEVSAITKQEASAEPKKEKENLDEHGLPILPTGDAEKDAEIKELHKIIQQERSHGQWSKQGLNLVSLTCLLLQSLFRGSNGKVGFKRCSAADWVFLVIFFMIMIAIVFIAVKMVAK